MPQSRSLALLGSVAAAVHTLLPIVLRRLSKQHSWLAEGSYDTGMHGASTAADPPMTVRAIRCAPESDNPLSIH